LGLEKVELPVFGLPAALARVAVNPGMERDVHQAGCRGWEFLTLAKRRSSEISMIVTHRRRPLRPALAGAEIHLSGRIPSGTVVAMSIA